MSNHQALYRETAKYVNSVVRRQVVTAKMFHEWVEEAKRVRQRAGMMGLISHYKKLYKQMLTDQEVEKLKRSPRKTELSYRLIDVLVEEGVLTANQAKWLKQYVK